MTDRTVTVLTTDYGPVTIPEPAWCAGLRMTPAAGRMAQVRQGATRTRA